MPDSGATPPGFAGRLAAWFIDSKLTPLVVIASILLGVFAVRMLPREEEPQIKVPMVDVLVSLAGADSVEVENRVTRPMEKLLWEIPGVEYLYSTSSPGRSLVIVRFEVGTDLEDALVRLNQKLQAHFDRIPAGASQPLVKPRTIDDVPVLAVTLHSATQDHFTLRRLAAQLDDAVKSIPQVAETILIGGQPRAVRVLLDPAALSAHGLDAAALIPVLQAANHQAQLGSRPFANAEVLLESGRYFRDATDLGSVVVAMRDGRPVHLHEVAALTDGPGEPADYVFFGAGGPAAPPGSEAAVTLSIAKRPGANAVAVVDAVIRKLDTLQGTVIPEDVRVTVTRDYGHTAAEKSNELLLHMGIAVFGVSLLILMFLGWRESLVVLLAVPSTLALTLLVFYLYGYTLNRITLFALIFSIGILVDDAIVVVENIVRHMRLPAAARRPLNEVALEAVAEVGNPTVLATWAVIAAILPMAFVGGLMGPYMRPIPIGATAAMLFSLLIAFTITPWAAVRVLRRRFVGKHAAGGGHSTEPNQGSQDILTRLYHRAMDPLLDRAPVRWAFLAGISILLLGAMALVAGGLVQVKMLPFDNKSEFQVILNTPEGTTLEETAQIAGELAESIRYEPVVRDFQIYAGTASPFNFNGLVRHYFLRSGPNVADLQVNLVPKGDRSEQSHAIAVRLRPRLAEIARRHGAVIQLAEVPPGPPVLQSLVAEIYGPDEDSRHALAGRVHELLAATPGVVDLDAYIEAPQSRVRYVLNRDLAAFHGVSDRQVAQSLELAAQGMTIDRLSAAVDREDVALRLELPASARSHPDALLDLSVLGQPGTPVPLRELVTIEHEMAPAFLYRKNLQPVTYVTADVAGEIESPAYALLALNRQLAGVDAREFGGADARLPILHLQMPKDDLSPALKWDGEWHITLEVFRDLGLAFAAVLVLIYMLMVGWFRNYTTPLVVMAAIPFSLIGILPAHWGLGAFFTATSMIGFMAGAGIVVRNSIILVDFIELRRAHGLALRDAVVEAGAVRFRPMLLTALAVVVGASVILADPIFQGLAISLMFGEAASLLISRMAVPVLYYMANARASAQTHVSQPNTIT